MSVLDQVGRTNPEKVVLYISTPGGGVFEGVSIYNYLRLLPFPVETCNFGTVDSIGAVIYAAGTRRTSVPQARFLLHGVQAQFGSGQSLEEPQIIERLKGLQIDTKNIARIIGATIGKDESAVTQLMLERTTLDPPAAIALGLVHAGDPPPIPRGATVWPVQRQPQMPAIQFQGVPTGIQLGLSGAVIEPHSTGLALSRS